MVRGTNGVAIAKKNNPAKISIAPIVTGSIKLRSLSLPREESAVVARSPVTYVCVGPPSLTFNWEMMSRMVTTFFRIGSVFAEPKDPGDLEKLTRTIMTLWSGLMKFCRIACGSFTGYVERVWDHRVWFA